MKILILVWKSFGNEDMDAAFKELGHETILYPFSDNDDKSQDELKGELVSAIRLNTPAFVFSFNYFPAAAFACKELGLPYVSWVYDSPYVRLYHYTVSFPTNRIFVFDKEQYLEFHHGGIQTVQYLPMAANTTRLSSMNDWDAFRKTPWFNQHEVAFIGSLYTEKHQFYQRMEKITPYTRGYLEGLMAAQSQVYGYNFVQGLLPKHIIEDMQNALPMKPGVESLETIEYLYAQYVINRQLTSLERQDLLQTVSKHVGLDLYTPDRTVQYKGCTNHGPVDYYDFAPYVFKQARINLNITLRSIHNGIPLRAFDILGAGGFLLTNFQADFLDFFVPGEDYDYFENKKDLLNKIDYYLSHEDERAQIARNGFNKIAAQHTYVHRAAEIIQTL